MPPEFTQFPKQWLLLRRDMAGRPSADAAANQAEFGGWLALAAPSVPLVPLRDAVTGAQAGLLIGWVIHRGRLLGHGDALVLDSDFETGVFPALSGRFVCLWRAAEGLRFRLDASGLLPAVFVPEAGIIASTTTLIETLVPLEPDAEVEAVFDFPRHRGFLPFGLTPRKGATRLLPGHRLDPATWAVERVWPEPELSAAPPMSLEEARIAAARVAAEVTAHVGAILAGGPGILYLSGGRDSRMVLAAARRFSGQITCETLANKSGIDLFLSRKVAQAAGARHVTLPILPASREEVAGWLHRTGNTIYDPVSTLGPTMERHDHGWHPMTGTGAEILRASNWWAEDLERPELTLDVLLNRLRLPDVPVIRRAAEVWMAGLPPMDATRALDVAKIDQIHGCWAAVSVYGHRMAHPSLHPFASQAINDTALRLPKAYNFAQGFYRDYMEQAWPEGLAIPVNRLTGFDRLRFPREGVKRMVPVKVKRWLKPLR